MCQWYVQKEILISGIIGLFLYNGEEITRLGSERKLLPVVRTCEDNARKKHKRK